jgi:hypothetical protein
VLLEPRHGHWEASVFHKTSNDQHIGRSKVQSLGTYGVHRAVLFTWGFLLSLSFFLSFFLSLFLFIRFACQYKDKTRDSPTPHPHFRQSCLVYSACTTLARVDGWIDGWIIKLSFLPLPSWGYPPDINYKVRCLMDKVTVGGFSPSHFPKVPTICRYGDAISSTLLHMSRLLPKPQHDPNLLPKPNVLVH